MIINFLFTHGNNSSPLPLIRSRRYRIERVIITVSSHDNLRHVLDSTSIFFRWYGLNTYVNIGTRTIPLRDFPIPIDQNELIFEVNMITEIVIPIEASNATISIIQDVDIPIRSIQVDLNDFT